MAKVFLKQAYEGMPQGANVGDQIEVAEDGMFQRLIDKGLISKDDPTRTAATADAGAAQRPTAGMTQEDRNAGNLNEVQARAANQRDGNAQPTTEQRPAAEAGRQPQDNAAHRLDAGGNRSTWRGDNPQASREGQQQQQQRAAGEKSPTAVGPMTTDTMRGGSKR